MATTGPKCLYLEVDNRWPNWSAAMKRCPQCKMERPAEDFYVRKSGPKAGQLHPWCKPCSRRRAKEWLTENPERRAAYNATQREKMKASPEARAKNAATAKRWREQNYDRWREVVAEAGLRKRYKMGSEQLKAMLAAQGFACALCETAISWETRHIDHIDTPNGPVVRGILCNKCNNGLGMLREDADLLRRAAEYVARYAA